MSGNPPPPPPLPRSLQANLRLGRWLRFSREGYVEVRSGKVELGQGILTALAQIAAEELDLRLDQVRMLAASTAASPDEAITSGSLSVQDSGSALRQACAEARAIYLEQAARRLEVEAAALTVSEGEIRGRDQRTTSYWAIADDALLACDATGAVVPKPAAAYRLVGAAAARYDLPDKIFGQPRFIHDLELPAMLHGRMVRPASPGAALLELDEGPARACGGVVEIVRDGSLLGVLADSAPEAERAAAKLAAGARWQPCTELPDERRLPAWLKEQPCDSSVVSRKVDARVNAPAIVRTICAGYAKPYLAHASIGPSCALARFDGGWLEVWTHSQGIYNLRRDLALAFRLEPAQVLVHHVQGAGCYGHNGADDVAYDACRLAQAVPGRPVRVQWSRADELSQGPLAPAMAIELEADLDGAGDVIGWRHTVWSNGHSLRPGRAPTPSLLGAWQLRQPFPALAAINAPLAAGGGSERNAVPPYDFPAWEIVNHRVLTMPLRTSAMRALGAVANVFAVESFIDELARETGADPIAFRLRRLPDPRARAVVERALAAAGWNDWQPAEGRGHGFAFARYKNSGAYCAVVAEIEAGVEIRATRLVIVVDVGRAINPDGVVNQIEGGAIQAASWTLKEAVRFDRERITSDNWEDYPILRFSEVPVVTVEIVESEQPSLGAGEASLGPTAGALANAVFDALGVRVRELPITAERIMAALDQI